MRRSLRYVLYGLPLAAMVLAGGTVVLLPQLAKSRVWQTGPKPATA